MGVRKDDSSVLITGAAGGIGQALVRTFTEAGYHVIGTDVANCPEESPCKYFIACDLQKTVEDETYAADIFGRIRQTLDGRPLTALINNAAVQVLGPVESLDRIAWRTTLDVNLLAPFFWAQALLPELAAARGMVLNISSIHARLTKPNFVAYATSKAALSGMTRAMAIELGAKVRVNAIEPAAIATPMLVAGFANSPNELLKLAACHPTGGIGVPEDLARLALTIATSDSTFLTGATLNFDGGISGVLCDPEAK